MKLPRYLRPVWCSGLGLSAVVLLSVASCQVSDPPIVPVFLDGALDEWAAAETIISDAADAPEAAIDIRWVQAMDDGEWLFLAFDVARKVNAQSMPGTLHLLLDTDDDSSTGAGVHGMRGVDVVVDLSNKPEPLAEGRGAGFAMRVAADNGVLEERSSYALGVAAAPTWAASHFELRVSRLGAPDIDPLGERIRVKAVYTEGDQVTDESDVGGYAFRTPAGVGAAGPRFDWSTREAGSVRVAVWNVSGQSFMRNAEGFARVLGALEADVVLLDEVVRGITPETVTGFFDREPLARLGDWGFVIGQTGGRQRTVVAARGRTIRPAESMRTTYYRAGELESLADRLPRSLDRLVELESQRGLSATGAWVDLGGEEVLFVPVDLQSAGWAGSPRDLLRVLQARTIRQRASGEAGDAPVVIGGDLNLVGSREPLDVLMQSLDTDGSDLVPVDAERIGERSYATWRFAEGQFAPGRLDFILVPDAAVEVTKSFVFTTEDLGAEELDRLDLHSGLSAELSDHLVVVADLRLR